MRRRIVTLAVALCAAVGFAAEDLEVGIPGTKGLQVIRHEGYTLGYASPSRVAVPPAFYKVIYDETPPRKMIGFIIKHKDSPGSLVSFACSVDEVERRTGLDFFSKVSGADEMEAVCRVQDWTLPGKEYRMPGAKEVAEGCEVRGDSTSTVIGGARQDAAATNEGWVINLSNGKRHKASCPNGKKAKRTRKCNPDEGVPAGCCGG